MLRSAVKSYPPPLLFSPFSLGHHNFVRSHNSRFPSPVPGRGSPIFRFSLPLNPSSFFLPPNRSFGLGLCEFWRQFLLQRFGDPLSFFLFLEISRTFVLSPFPESPPQEVHQILPIRFFTMTFFDSVNFFFQIGPRAPHKIPGLIKGWGCSSPWSLSPLFDPLRLTGVGYAFASPPQMIGSLDHPRPFPH